MKSSHHFTYLRSLFDIIFTFVFFTYHDIFTILQIERAVIFLEISFFLGQIRNQRPKSLNNGWCGDRFAEKKMVITTWPNDLLGIFWERGYDVSSPTEKF